MESSMKKPDYLQGDCLTVNEWIDQNPIPLENKYMDGLLMDQAEWGLKTSEVHEFKNQPFTKDMIVRPEEPKFDENAKWAYYQNQHQKEMKAWQNWQPLFEGEWEVVDRLNIDYAGYSTLSDGCILVPTNGTTDDFIREAKKAGIKLRWKMK